jgi:hypothetical protein
MIVNKATTDAKREGFLNAYVQAYGGGGAHLGYLESVKAFPYKQERVVTIEVGGKPVLYKVQAEDDDDYEAGYSAGTLLVKTPAKSSTWGVCYARVTEYTPTALRQLADLFDNPLENYIEPQQEVATT